MSYLLAVLPLAAALPRPHSGLSVDTELLLRHVKAVNDPPVALDYDQPLAELVHLHIHLRSARFTLCLCHLDLRIGNPFVGCPAAAGAPPPPPPPRVPGPSPPVPTHAHAPSPR